MRRTEAVVIPMPAERGRLVQGSGLRISNPSGSSRRENRLSETPDGGHRHHRHASAGLQWGQGFHPEFRW